MAYLNFDEFKKLNPLSALAESNEDEFKKWILYASNQLDGVTGFYYQIHDLQTDPWPFRAQQFKQALALQVGELYRLQATTNAEVQDRPTATTIGRTNVTAHTQSQQTGDARTAIASDVRTVLLPTGLLYRGGDRYVPQPKNAH